MRRVGFERQTFRPFVDALEPRRLMATSVPAADEQLFIELLNSARANPTGYAIAHGLPVTLSDATPQPPLAVNGNLEYAAQFKATEMATNNYVGSQSPVTGKYANDLARDAGYALPSSYLAARNDIESVTAGYLTPESTLNALLTAPASRNHLLGTGSFFVNHNEIGFGHASSASSIYGDYWSAMTAYTNTGSKFLTGVAYTDAVTTNAFYTPGEGLAGATITATPVGGGTAVTTTTLASGGYSLPLATGTYTVTASGPGFATPVTFSNVSVGSVNVKRDFVSPVVVQALTIDDGTAQRSRVRSLTIAFDKAVTLDAGAITLVGRGGVGAGTTLNLASTDGKTWTVTFAGTPVLFASLADGVYDLTVVATKVHAGSATGPAMAANYTAVVKRLFGDVTGDGRVNITDFNTFATSFGTTAGQSNFTAAFDYDNSGGITITDFNQFVTRFGLSI